jgi:ribosome maturation factor RimP
VQVPAGGLGDEAPLTRSDPPPRHAGAAQGRLDGVGDGRVRHAGPVLPSKDGFRAARRFGALASAGPEVGARPLFLWQKEDRMTSLQDDIEARLAARAPDVEVLLAEVVGGDTLRLFIDHPDGVTLELCERVTHELGDVRERYTLEVSSPGRERPLTKPAHFRRFLGRRARVRTRIREQGRRSYTGELVGASEESVTIAADGGVVSIPYVSIQRSNLVEE